MARKKIQPVDLSATVSQILEDYGADVGEILDEAIIDAAEDAVHKLRAVNKFSPLGNPTGAYSASWTMEPMRVSRYQISYLIYNENHYRLAHLLEYGHALVSGGRKIGDVQAYSHIRDIHNAVNVELVRNFMRRLESIK